MRHEEYSGGHHHPEIIEFYGYLSYQRDKVAKDEEYTLTIIEFARIVIKLVRNDNPHYLLIVNLTVWKFSVEDFID